jgi:hypothetical protein
MNYNLSKQQVNIYKKNNFFFKQKYKIIYNKNLKIKQIKKKYFIFKTF